MKPVHEHLYLVIKCENLIKNPNCILYIIYIVLEYTRQIKLYQDNYI